MTDAQAENAAAAAASLTAARRVPTAPSRGGNPGGRRRPRHGWAPYLYIAPYAVLLLAFGIGPALYAVYSSLTTYGIAGGTTWAGLSNWVAVANDYRLGASVVNVGKYLLIWLPLLVAVVVTLALALNARQGRFTRLMTLVYYIPGAVTGSAAALVWLYMLSPGLSPFTPILEALNITSVTAAVDTDRLPFVLAIMGTAIHAGSWIVILYGALAAIPSDYLEAARIDGATSFQIIRYIKLPVIRHYLVLVLVSSFAAGTQVFVEPAVLSVGAPGQISPTWSTNQLAYYFATQFGQFGQAAALSVGLFSIGLIAAIIVLTRTNFYTKD